MKNTTFTTTKVLSPAGGGGEARAGGGSLAHSNHNHEKHNISQQSKYCPPPEGVARYELGEGHSRIATTTQTIIKTTTHEKHNKT